MRLVGMPKSEARLRTRYCESKKSSVVTCMPRERTMASTVLISTPGMPPHTRTWILFSHAANMLEPHGSSILGLRAVKLYELYERIQCSSGSTRLAGESLAKHR